MFYNTAWLTEAGVVAGLNGKNMSNTRFLESKAPDPSDNTQEGGVETSTHGRYYVYFGFNFGTAHSANPQRTVGNGRLANTSTE